MQVEQFRSGISAVRFQGAHYIRLLLLPVGMLLYISFRFQLSYGIAAIITLLHDVFVLLGIYTIFQITLMGALSQPF